VLLERERLESEGMRDFWSLSPRVRLVKVMSLISILFLNWGGGGF